LRRRRPVLGRHLMSKTVLTNPGLIKFLNTMQNHMKLCGYSSGTVKAYTGQVQGFIRFNRPANLRNITLQDIQNHLNQLVNSGLSRSTIDQATKAMEILYYELFEKQLKLLELKRPRKKRLAPIVLTPGEVYQIASHAKTSRNRLMIKLAYSAGLRVSELVVVKAEDLNLDKLTLHVSGFDRNQRVASFSKHIKGSLIKHIEDKNTSQYLFPSERGGTLTTRAVAKFFKKALIASGLKKLATPHSLRQSFVSFKVDQDAGPLAVKSTLDLKSLNLVPSPDSKKAA
jgi:integrase/recombinase XerD